MINHTAAGLACVSLMEGHVVTGQNTFPQVVLENGLGPVVTPKTTHPPSTFGSKVSVSPSEAEILMSPILPETME